MGRTRGIRASPLHGLVRDGDGVVVLGLAELEDDAWSVLMSSGLRLLRVADLGAAVAAVADGAAQIVVAGARDGPALIDDVRTRPELAAVHVVVCADLDAPHELRDALDAGADDVMRIPFEPEVLEV